MPKIKGLFEAAEFARDCQPIRPGREESCLNVPDLSRRHAFRGLVVAVPLFGTSYKGLVAGWSATNI